MRLALALLLLVAGCSVQTYPDQDTEETRELRAFGAEAWLNAGVSAPDDYTLALVPAEELAELCDGECRGCSYSEARAILLDDSLSPEDLHIGIVHELGHLVSGKGHLQCDRHGRGPDTMCPQAASAKPTARDIGFVRGR